MTNAMSFHPRDGDGDGSYIPPAPRHFWAAPIAQPVQNDDMQAVALHRRRHTVAATEPLPWPRTASAIAQGVAAMAGGVHASASRPRSYSHSGGAVGGLPADLSHPTDGSRTFAAASGLYAGAANWPHAPDALLPCCHAVKGLLGLNENKAALSWR
jgi:hypothetical protein